MREVKLLQSIRHDNVICLLDVFHVRRRLYLVFEYIEGTVLQVGQGSGKMYNQQALRATRGETMMICAIPRNLLEGSLLLARTKGNATPPEKLQVSLFESQRLLQELERCPHGLGDVKTRQIMWQLVRAVEHLHSNQVHFQACLLFLPALHRLTKAFSTLHREQSRRLYLNECFFSTLHPQAFIRLCHSSLHTFHMQMRSLY